MDMAESAKYAGSFLGSLLSMRKWLFNFFLLSASFSTAIEGTFKPASGQPVPWSIDGNGTLIWDGQPWVPKGLQLPAQTEAIESAARNGFRDVMISVEGTSISPEAIGIAEKLGLRYMIRFNSLAPSSVGVDVQPQGYRIDGIDKETRVEFAIPGAKSALVILAAKRDSAVVESSFVKIDDGVLRFATKPSNGLEHVLLVYPVVPFAAEPDFWDEFDSQRDRLLTSLKKSSFGPGFRGIVNPIGQVLSPRETSPHFVPTSRFFRLELKNYLVKEYRNLNMAFRVWAVTPSDIESFDQLSRLVPLWSGSRGVPQLWDPQTNKLYSCDSKKSLIWRDINLIKTQTAMRRFRNLLASIKKIVDAPIVQEWIGWNGFYSEPDVKLTGIAAPVFGASVSAVFDEASRPASLASQSSVRPWMTCTELNFAKPVPFSQTMDDLLTMGYKGWFARPATEEALKEIANYLASSPGDSVVASTKVSAVYFPENAMNPAVPQRLPGGKWWLPTPLDGNRIDLGNLFSAYRYIDKSGPRFVIWSRSGAIRTKLFMSNPKMAVFESIDGTSPNPKVLKDGVEVTIGEYPMIIHGIDEIPVPEPSYAETILHFDELLKVAEQQMRDTTEERFFFKDNLNGFKRNPGGSFSMLRKQLSRLNQKMAQFTWIEAEATKNTTFSDVKKVSGCSGGECLYLQTPIIASRAPWYAEYTVKALPGEDLNVWIAAKIPEGQRNLLQLLVGDQVLRIEESPTGFYSSGFAWYRLGTTRFADRNSLLRIEVKQAEGIEMSIDAILLIPGNFSPRGSSMPNAITQPILKSGKR